jgi:hypothetical protein
MNIFEDSMVLPKHIKVVNSSVEGEGDLHAFSLIPNCTPPKDWHAGRYKYDGVVWSAVEGWVDPREGRIAALRETLEKLEKEFAED